VRLRDTRFADLVLLEFWGNWAWPIAMLLATPLGIIADRFFHLSTLPSAALTSTSASATLSAYAATVAASEVSAALELGVPRMEG